MLTWFREHRVALMLGACFCTVAFVAGHSAREPDVKTVEHVVYRDRVVTVTKVEREEAKTRVVYRERTVSPDGTRHETEVEREDTHATEHAATTAVADHSADVSKSTTVTSARADSRVGVLLGANLQLAPQIGVIVERQVLGPVSAGAWVLVQPSPVFNLAGGLSVSVAF
jgi:hypothetical protein